MAKEVKVCSHCGAKIVEYPHNLNKGMIQALYALYLYDGPANLQEDLSLTHNQYTNFYKLRYWSLAKSTGVEGKWQITDRGKAFVRGETNVQKKVWSYRGKALRFEGDYITARDYIEVEYKKRDYYVEESVPH